MMWHYLHICVRTKPMMAYRTNTSQGLKFLKRIPMMSSPGTTRTPDTHAGEVWILWKKRTTPKLRNTRTQTTPLPLLDSCNGTLSRLDHDGLLSLRLLIR